MTAGKPQPPSAYGGHVLAVLEVRRGSIRRCRLSPGTDPSPDPEAALGGRPILSVVVEDDRQALGGAIEAAEGGLPSVVECRLEPGALGPTAGASAVVEMVVLPARRAPILRSIEVLCRDVSRRSELERRLVDRLSLEEAVGTLATMVASGELGVIESALGVLGAALGVDEVVLSAADGAPTVQETRAWGWRGDADTAGGGPVPQGPPQGCRGARGPMIVGRPPGSGAPAVPLLLRSGFGVADGVGLYVPAAGPASGRLGLWLGSRRDSRRWSEQEVGLLGTAAALLAGLVAAREAQEEAARERAQLLSVFEAIECGIYVADTRSYEILYANACALSVGKPLIGRRCYEALQNRDSPCPFCTNPALEASPDEPYRWEHYNTVRDRHYAIYNRLIRWPDGRRVRFEMDVDVTELRRAREALAAESARLAVTLRSISDGVITTDAAGSTTYLNPSAERLLGVGAAAASGLPLWSLIEPLLAGEGLAVADLVFDVLATGTPRGLRDVELRGRAAGERRWIEVHAGPMMAAGSAVGVVVALRDVTDAHRLAQTLARADRLESIGTLAAGIAHDFNNQLTAILGATSLARETEGIAGETARLLEIVEGGARKASAVARQLITFTRGGEPVREPIANLAEIAREAAAFALQGSRSGLRVASPESLWSVRADGAQIGQVVQNLVLNAAQAMPAGGLVTVELTNAVLGGDNALSLPAGRYVAVTVRDTGAGIPLELQSRVFDPYFTTKADGAGLGLTMVHSVVKRHGGAVELESRPGVGTAVTFHLPADGGSPEPTIRPPSPADIRASGARRRVLVMDDDGVILRLLGSMLERIGHEVTLTADGDQALREYRKALDRGERFGLAILDLTVPGGTGGVAAFEMIRSIDASAVAVATSGYADDPVIARPGDWGFAASLPKPYRLAELREALARASAGTGSAATET